MQFNIFNIDNLLAQNLKTYDPYDLWKTNFGVWLRRLYYKHGLISIPLVGPFYIMDTYAPKVPRLFINPQEYPIVRALATLSALNLYDITFEKKYLKMASISVNWLIENQTKGYHGACWGLNFPWMTKNIYYPENTPFITHTPYCVEALLKYYDVVNDDTAKNIALSGLHYLEKDINILLDDNDKLALSYGPCKEDRIVLNANSYAMMMYALYARRIINNNKYLTGKAERIFNYIKSRQNIDGSWYYYDDNEKGNFIDCFHSCFILKNLIKYARYLNVNVDDTINKGIDYIIRHLLDSNIFLVKRFSISSNISLVKYDIYDQAEFLNILIMKDNYELARKLYQSIIDHFFVSSENTFGSQIYKFGKLNKMNYLRWAVMPTIFVLTEYHKKWGQ